MKRYLIVFLLIFAVGCAGTPEATVAPTAEPVAVAIATNTSVPEVVVTDTVVAPPPTVALATETVVVLTETVETETVVLPTETVVVVVEETEMPAFTPTTLPPTNTPIPPSPTTPPLPTNTPAPAVNYLSQAGQMADGSFYRGNPNALVTVKDYSDFL